MRIHPFSTPICKTDISDIAIPHFTALLHPHLDFLITITKLPTKPTKNPSGQIIRARIKKKGSSPPFQKFLPKKWMAAPYTIL